MRRRRRGAILWALALALGAWHYLVAAVAARTLRIEAFDGGIQTSTIDALTHGRVPIADFYEPYGIGVGVPGLLPRLVGADSVLAERLTYALFGALATALAVVLVGRWSRGRLGPVLAGLTGVATLAGSTPRYAAPWCAVLGFALLVQAAGRRSNAQDLATIAREHPRRLDVAAVVLSLAGWMRVEYAGFALVWAAILLVLAGRSTGRPRAAVSAGVALVPTLIIVLAGGASHLWWVVRYDLVDFRHARGIPIDWGVPGDWVGALAHGHLFDQTAGTIVASYGVAVITALAAVTLLAYPGGRAFLRRADGGTGILLLLFVVSVVVLYAQSARFSVTYGETAVVIFALPAVLLLDAWLASARRCSARVIALAAVTLLILPLLRPQMPDAVRDQWRDRPVTTAREPIPGYNRIGMYSTDQERSLAALPAVWRARGLAGRETLSIGRTNFTAWGNDAIVGGLLHAPPAAWTLTYDPGLVNRDDVQREVVADLCANNAPLVQAETTYPDLGNYGVRWGSTRLDEHVALNYRLDALAGFYRILVPTGCRTVDAVSTDELARLRDARLRASELPEAGALALARLRRSHDPQDAAVAVLGGFGHYVPKTALPRDDAGEALARFVANARDPEIAARAVLATHDRPVGIALAVQNAWASGRQPGEAQEAQVLPAMVAFAERHPDLGGAIGVLRGVLPGGDVLFAELEKAGAHTLELLRWRFDTLAADPARVADLAVLGRRLVAAYDARRDPVQAAAVEIAVATVVEPKDAGCAATYLAHADAAPGIWLAPHGPAGSCRQAGLAPPR